MPALRGPRRPEDRGLLSVRLAYNTNYYITLVSTSKVMQFAGEDAHMVRGGCKMWWAMTQKIRALHTVRRPPPPKKKSFLQISLGLCRRQNTHLCHDPWLQNMIIEAFPLFEKYFTWTWATTMCPPSTSHPAASERVPTGSRKNWREPLKTTDEKRGSGRPIPWFPGILGCFKTGRLLQ